MELGRYALFGLRVQGLFVEFKNLGLSGSVIHPQLQGSHYEHNLVDIYVYIYAQIIYIYYICMYVYMHAYLFICIFYLVVIYVCRLQSEARRVSSK